MDTNFRKYHILFCRSVLAQHVTPENPVYEKVPDIGKPYTAYEVLTEFFGEDMSLVLGNYVKINPVDQMVE